MLTIPIKVLKELAEQEDLTEIQSKTLLHWYIKLTCNISINLVNIPITNKSNYDEKLEYAKDYFKSFVID